jgi:hypothetical protein
VEKDLLPAADKESAGLISKGMPSLSKGDFTWGAYKYAYRKHFGGAHS